MNINQTAGTACVDAGPETVSTLVSSYATGVDSLKGRVCSVLDQLNEKVDGIVGPEQWVPQTANSVDSQGTVYTAQQSALAEISSIHDILDKLESCIRRV